MIKIICISVQKWSPPGRPLSQVVSKIGFQHIENISIHIYFKEVV